MSKWTEGQKKDGQISVSRNGQMDKCMGEWKEGRTDGWMDGQIDCGQAYRQTDRHTDGQTKG